MNKKANEMRVFVSVIVFIGILICLGYIFDFVFVNQTPSINDGKLSTIKTITNGLLNLQIFNLPTPLTYVILVPISAMVLWIIVKAIQELIPG